MRADPAGQERPFTTAEPYGTDVQGVVGLPTTLHRVLLSAVLRALFVHREMVDTGERSSTFEHAVAVILDRWKDEGITRLTAAEIEQARSYLHQHGVRTHPVEGGQFMLEKSGRVIQPAHLILIGVRHLAAARVRTFGK
jgi:hypothetical protein